MRRSLVRFERALPQEWHEVRAWSQDTRHTGMKEGWASGKSRWSNPSGTWTWGRHSNHKWRVIQDKAAVPSAFCLFAFETYRIFIGFVKCPKGGKFWKYMRKEKNNGTGFHMVREGKWWVEAEARHAHLLFSYHPLSSIPVFRSILSVFITFIIYPLFPLIIQALDPHFLKPNLDSTTV